MIALVEELVNKEPHEAFGFIWAARPQLYYWEALGVEKWTLVKRIRKPPFVARRAKIDGKQVCLLRVGVPGPKDENDYKRALLSMMRTFRDNAKPCPILYGTAGQDEAAAKAADQAAKAAAEKGDDVAIASAVAAAEARAAFKAKERKEGQMLWGFAKDVMKLSAWAELPKDIEERLILKAFKYALSKEAWPFVASGIKFEMESKGHKVMFLDYPSISHIRLYWRAVVNAYVTHWQGDGDDGSVPNKYLNKIGAVSAFTDPFVGHPGWTADIEARSDKTEALWKAKQAKLAAAKAEAEGAA